MSLRKKKSQKKEKKKGRGCTGKVIVSRKVTLGKRQCVYIVHRLEANSLRCRVAAARRKGPAAWSDSVKMNLFSK